MSTGRKWFLALALVGAFSFFMYMFPTKVDSAIRGHDIWLVPGYAGSVGVDTGVAAINGLWSGTLTLSADAGGATVVTDSVTSTQDWDQTLSIKRSFSKARTLHVSFRVRLPADVRSGSVLAGSVTGDIVTPQHYQGGFFDTRSAVDRPVTFHVADKAEVTRHSDATQRWPLWPWTRWLLWLPLIGFVLTTERVSTRIARRVNA